MLSKHVPIFGLLFSLLFVDSSYGQILDFDELSLAPESFFDGYGSNAAEGSWRSQNAVFHTQQFGPGWSYSNISDNTTPGFQNQWSAITGVDKSGDGNYALANAFSPATIVFDNLMKLNSIQVTNSTYAALSMLNGDSFSKKFGGTSGNDPDFLTLTIKGYQTIDSTGPESGSLDFLLADFRFSDNTLDYVVDQWASVDLSGFGATRSLQFSLDGSDVGQFGLNTPAYFAIDEISMDTIPEPSGLGITFFIVSTFISRRRPDRVTSKQQR